MAEKEAASAEENAAPGPKSGGMMGKLLLAGFMGVVVAIECLLAYFLVPSAEDVSAITRDEMRKSLPASLNPDDGAGGEDDAKKTVEIDLGQYSVTVTQPNSSTALLVDFLLVGTLLEEDEKECTAQFDRHVHRFRDQILFEIRNSGPADLADPGLGLIKRRILEKSNALFGKPILKSIVFSQFSYVEQ